MKNDNQKIYNIIATIMFIVSLIMIFTGYDKITNYSNVGDTITSLSKNAYVGGDAYNYIINGTYATSYFVLATLFALVGIGFVIIGYLDKIKHIKVEQIKQNSLIDNNYIVERILSDDYGQELDKKVMLRLSELKNYTIDSVNIIDTKNYGNKYEAYITYHQ